MNTNSRGSDKTNPTRKSLLTDEHNMVQSQYTQRIMQPKQQYFVYLSYTLTSFTVENLLIATIKIKTEKHQYCIQTYMGG